MELLTKPCCHTWPHMSKTTWNHLAISHTRQKKPLSSVPSTNYQGQRFSAFSNHSTLCLLLILIIDFHLRWAFLLHYLKFGFLFFFSREFTASFSCPQSHRPLPNACHCKAMALLELFCDFPGPENRSSSLFVWQRTVTLAGPVIHRTPFHFLYESYVSCWSSSCLQYYFL